MNDRNSLRPFRLRPIAKLRSPVIAVQQPPLTASLSTALSLALSLPLALHSLPQLSLPLSASLSLIFFFFLRSHSLPHSLFLSFTYLMSFNRTALALAMSLRKCQANLFHANFLKCHRYENVRVIPSSFFFFSGQSTSCSSCGKNNYCRYRRSISFVTVSDVSPSKLLICPPNSPKPKDSQFALMNYEKKKQQVLTFKKLEL